MDPATYEAWYRTARVAWIGNVEFGLLERALRPERRESLLDVGCGTGDFKRRFAIHSELRVVGLDPNPSWLEFARAHAAAGEGYCVAARSRCPLPTAVSIERLR